MSDTWIADNEDETLLGCRRRRSDKPQWSSNGGVVGETHNYNRDSGKMAPRSFEHQIYISMSRTGHQLAFLSRGLISCFISRLDGISNFCAIYSFTGILFTVSYKNSLISPVKFILILYISHPLHLLSCLL